MGKPEDRRKLALLSDDLSLELGGWYSAASLVGLEEPASRSSLKLMSRAGSRAAVQTRKCCVRSHAEREEDNCCNALASWKQMRVVCAELWKSARTLLCWRLVQSVAPSGGQPALDPSPPPGMGKLKGSRAATTG